MDDAEMGPITDGDDGKEAEGDEKGAAANVEGRGIGDEGGTMRDAASGANSGAEILSATNDVVPLPSRSVDSCPRCYKFLFHVEKELVVSCYNWLTCGIRVMFQGSRFSEAVISVYRCVIMMRTLSFAVVPR